MRKRKYNMKNNLKQNNCKPPNTSTSSSTVAVRIQRIHGRRGKYTLKATAKRGHIPQSVHDEKSCPGERVALTSAFINCLKNMRLKCLLSLLQFLFFSSVILFKNFCIIIQRHSQYYFVNKLG